MAACKAAVCDAEGAEQLLNHQEDEAKDAVAKVSEKVQNALQSEDVALEKLKAAKTAKAEAAMETKKAVGGLGEIEKMMKVLESHMEGNQKLLDLERKKKEAAEAKEAAKKAAEEAKKREKELAEERKAALHEQKTKASETLKGLKNIQTSEQKMQKEDGREKKVQEKQEKKALAAELAQINKMRQDREKERQQRLKQAGSKSKSKRAADDVQCPSKAARIVEDNP